MMRTVWPGERGLSKTEPAGRLPTTNSSRAPTCGTSWSVTAYPSTAELSAGGTSKGAHRRSARTRPRALAIGMISLGATVVTESRM